MDSTLKKIKEEWEKRNSISLEEFLKSIGMIAPFEMKCEEDFGCSNVICKTKDEEEYVIFIRFEEEITRVWVANTNAPCSTGYYQF